MTDQQQIDQAIAHQKAGQLEKAEALYWQVFVRQPHNNFVRHNLGIVLLALGDYRTGPAMVREAILLDRDNPSLAESYRTVGLSLYRAGYWEAARDWLEQAIDHFPTDVNIRAALDRSAPRTYLAPEIYDPTNDRVLRRYAPRESGNYVYTIDIVGTCNLRCPTCPVGNFPTAIRNRGFMSEGMFDQILRKIIDESPVQYPDIWLYSWGEPILHPKLPQFIEKVKDYGCRVHLSSNLNIKQSDKLDAIIRSGPTSLKISLSGFAPETYSTTHVRGDLALLQENMRRIAQSRARYQVNTHIWVGQHVYRSNQGDVASVAALCRELAFDHFPIAAFFQPLEKLAEVVEGNTADKPILNDLLEMPTDYVARIKAGRGRRYDCELRFNQTVINHDGEVSLCCSVYDKANMLGVSFLDTPREEIEALKYSHPFCKKCYGYGMEYAASEPIDRVDRRDLPPAYIETRDYALDECRPLINLYHATQALAYGYVSLDGDGQLQIDEQLQRNYQLLNESSLFGRRLAQPLRALLQYSADVPLAEKSSVATKIEKRLHEAEVEAKSIRSKMRFPLSGEVYGLQAMLQAKTDMETIPRVIHFIKTDPIPDNFQLLHYLSIRSALETCPDYRVVLHSSVEPRHALWEKIRARVQLEIHAPPQQIGNKALFLAAHQSDAWRVDLLIEQGGIYLDWDVILLRPLDALLANKVLLAVEDRVAGFPEVMGVAFIAAQANAPFLHTWKERMGQTFSPGCYTCHSTELARKLALSYPEWVNVLGAESFYRPGWTSHAADELFSENHLTRDALLNGRFKNSYGIHVFESHANMIPYLSRLTPDSVLNENTCFNTLVRPYLAAE